MADVDDKEKAEKLAAAKKRFEQLKKQKVKKGGKKKADKGEASEAKEDESTAEPSAEVEAEGEAEAPAEGEPAGGEPAEGEPAEVAAEVAAEVPAEVKPEADKEETPAETEEKEEERPAEEAPAEEKEEETSEEKPTHSRKPSSTQQSRQRSASFRQNSGVISPVATKSPGLPSISAEDEVQDIYRKQASRIEELEKENKTLKDSQAKLQKVEDELEQLRESSGHVAELKSKAALAEKRQEEIEKLKSDLTSTQRQLTLAQQQAQDKRRKSNASPTRELGAQLAAKTSTIESLELELSNLRNQYNLSQSSISTHEATIKELDQRATTAEAAAETTRNEISTLKHSMSQPAESENNSAEDTKTLQTKLTVLESDLRTAKADAETAASRAISLEQKIETLTKVHKDTNTSHEKDIQSLTSKLASLKAKQVPQTDTIDDDIIDQEQESLLTRIRDLEAENYNLKSGVWREQRLALQPDINDTSPGYEDVDLNNPYAVSRPHARTSSSFQDVLQSGISAFTGRDRAAAHDRNGGSLGLLSEEGFDFDEDAFAAAQEDEGKKRIERVREIKRGLDGWRGWRLDVSDVRAGGLGAVSTGPLFEL